MIPNPQALPILSVFDKPTGKEYALQWTLDGTEQSSGSIKMTDYLFNYYFFPTAFGIDGAASEKNVRGSTYSRTRVIGGPSVQVTRAPYKYKVRPTYRGGAYDTGMQMYAIDGKDIWNFEVSGNITEFRAWLDKVASTGNLKKTLQIKTATGVGSTHVPFTTTT
jgi:hypothetical protein